MMSRLRRVFLAAVVLLAAFLTLVGAQQVPADAGRPPGTDGAGVVPHTGPTLVIDPGHGGDDTGTRGAAGTQEKQLTLDIAHRLKPLLEARFGARVVLTRDADVAVSHDARIALANSSKGALFLSLHANAAPSSVVEGAEVYYLQLDREGERVRDTRQSVSLPVVGGGHRVLALVPWDLAQARHLEHSALFAEAIAQALAGRVPVGPSPLRRAPLRVLEGIDMPAALVEVAFLSSADQEKLARTEEFRQTLAQALTDAIAGFLEPGEGPRTR